MRCPNCEKEYDDSFVFCPYCGQERPAEVPVTPAGPPVPPQAEQPSRPDTGVTAPPEAGPTRPGAPAGPPRAAYVPKSALIAETPEGKKRKRSGFGDWWGGLSRRNRYGIVGIAAAAIAVIIIAAVVGGTGDSERAEDASVERESTTVETTAVTEEEGKTFEDFVTIENVTDYQELTRGINIISGTAEEGCTLTCNGQPVGILPDTRRFEQSAEIAEGPNTVTFEVTDEDGEKHTKALTLTGVLSPEEYKAVSPAGPGFAELDKNPDGFAGTRCKYRGQVVQAMESMGRTDLRVDITPMGYGYWTDTIYVTYAGTTPAVEDSIVWVYGTVKGSYTYTSQAGWDITLPHIEAKYIDVVQ